MFQPSPARRTATTNQRTNTKSTIDEKWKKKPSASDSLGGRDVAALLQVDAHLLADVAVDLDERVEGHVAHGRRRVAQTLDDRRHQFVERQRVAAVPVAHKKTQRRQLFFPNIPIAEPLAGSLRSWQSEGLASPSAKEHQEGGRVNESFLFSRMEVRASEEEEGSLRKASPSAKEHQEGGRVNESFPSCQDGGPSQ